MGRGVEERRGSRIERLIRVAGRGREETTPVVVHNLVFIVVALFAGVVIAIALVLWLVLR
jgi:hypothetical protein